MSARKYNKFAIIVLILFGISIAIMNISLYKMGADFAEKYNAPEWRVEFTESEGGHFSSEASGIAWSSYYKYIDENGRNFIQSNRLYKPYNDMNLIVYNVVETYGIISIMVLIIGVLGLTINRAKRFNYSGYIFVIIAGFYGTLQQGIMNNGSAFIPITCLVAVILISKSRFVDWNGSLLLTFSKDK